MVHNMYTHRIEGTDRPKVAVIIPFYNGANYVERAINSVIAQTVPPDEFIIVNDGSKPEEREALSLLSAKYEFIIIDKENGGQGSARNVGIAASKSAYISLLDQDDYYLPNHIKDLVALLPSDDPRCGFVYADLCEGDRFGRIVQSSILRALPYPRPWEGHIRDLLRNDLFILPSASLIYRSAFEAIGGFDEQFRGYEDDDLFLRFFRAGYTSYFLDKPVTVWCMHTASTSYSITMSRSRFKYFKKLANTFEDEPAMKLFYFRDSLIPRFGPAFIEDSIKAIRCDKDTAELNGYLREYAMMVYANKSVSLKYKVKLFLLVSLLTRFPVSLVLMFGKTGRLPFVRRIIPQFITSAFS